MVDAEASRLRHALCSADRPGVGRDYPKALCEYLLAQHHAAPYGSGYPFELDGRRHLARLEQHYHEPGGPLKPWGYHPGISLFVAVVLGSEVPLDDGECP